MGTYWSVKNYMVVVGSDNKYENRNKVTKEVINIIRKATFECQTQYTSSIHTYAECFNIACWLENEPLMHFDDGKALKGISKSLKNSDFLIINRSQIIKKKRVLWIGT